MIALAPAEAAGVEPVLAAEGAGVALDHGDSYNRTMRILTADPPPAELAAVIERRRTLGQDTHDEVWEGVYHVTPGPSNAHGYVQAELMAVLHPHAQMAGLFASTEFNLGEADDYRVPDGGYHRERVPGVRLATAAIVVEILSPGDETFEKFDFYARHDVEEIIVVDPEGRTVDIWLAEEVVHRFGQAPASRLLQVTAAEMAAAIDWP